TPPAQTTVNNANLTSPGNFIKSADKEFADVGDIITYTIVAKNTGNVPANNVVISDPLPNGTAFIVGSITSTAPFTGTNPATGITLTNPIPAGGTVTITYKLKVTQIPVPNPIANVANVAYTYTVDPANPNGATSKTSTPPVNTTVNHVDFSSPGNFSKTADKKFANIGDVVTYTVVAKNTGNVPANNVVIKDTIPNGATFISGSITSTAPYTGTDPNTGLTLTNPIPAGGTVTITYKVKVTSIPVPNPIENTATINFTYTVDPANPNGANGSVTTPPADTTVNHADLTSPGNFTKTADKKFADIGDI
ncbi:MAG: DUF11 domain-containing protein, partial [Bacilli bacterium]